ncbi:MAG: hypothetical protein C5B49_05385 [Bdellovibrio sp.]|nr:MAG: hypothetical protein C5B49_05385 [Bdellovibrio sp.]
MTNFSDEELMSHYQSGDVRAFECLYERHAGRVLRFLRKKTNPESAHDLLQEVFLKVHRSRHQYSAQYPFLPWLFAITRNALADLARLNETKVARNSIADLEMLEVAIPSQEAWTEELSLALKCLPTHQRRAIELRYLSDWTFEKIAEDIKTTPLNVRQIISRGIKKLRSALGGSRG